MKEIALVLLVIVGSVSSCFAQSKKEVNAQLRASYASELQRYDSLMNVHRSQVQLIEIARNKLRMAYQLEFRDELIKDQEKVDKVKSTISTLNNLGIRPDETELGTIVADLAHLKTRMEHNWAHHKEQFATVVVFQSLRDTLQLEGVKVKAQNPLLEQQIALYRTVFEENRQRAVEEKALLDGLNSLKDELALGMNERQETAERLRWYTRKIDEQLEAERQRYMNDGPKGFSKAYQETFGIPSKVSMATSDEVKVLRDDPKIATEIGFEPYDVEAEFPGGRAALLEYFQKNLRFPDMGDKTVNGKVHVRFVISASGKISEVVLVRGMSDCSLCDAEAIRVIEAMPDWKPASLNGKAVSSTFQLPIRFQNTP